MTVMLPRKNLHGLAFELAALPRRSEVLCRAVAGLQLLAFISYLSKEWECYRGWMPLLHSKLILLHGPVAFDDLPTGGFDADMAVPLFAQSAGTLLSIGAALVIVLLWVHAAASKEANSLLVLLKYALASVAFAAPVPATQLCFSFFQRTIALRRDNMVSAADVLLTVVAALVLLGVGGVALNYARYNVTLEDGKVCESPGAYPYHVLSLAVKIMVSGVFSLRLPLRVCVVTLVVLLAVWGGAGVYFAPWRAERTMNMVNATGCSLLAVSVVVGWLACYPRPATFLSPHYWLVPVMVVAARLGWDAMAWRLDYQFSAVHKVGIDQNGRAIITFSSPTDVVLAAGMCETPSRRSAILAAGRAQFPTSATVVLEELRVCALDDNGVVVLLRDATKLCKDAGTLFRLYTLQRLHAASLAREYGDASQTFHKELHTARRHHFNALRSDLYFWENIAKGNIDLSRLPVISQTMALSCNSARRKYASLMEQFPDSDALIRSYASFLEDLDMDFVKALRYRQRIEDSPLNDISLDSLIRMEDSASTMNSKAARSVTSRPSVTPSMKQFVKQNQVAVLLAKQSRRAEQMATYKRNLLMKISSGALRELSRRTVFALMAIPLFSIVAYLTIRSQLLVHTDSQLQRLSSAGTRGVLVHDVVAFAGAFYDSLANNSSGAAMARARGNFLNATYLLYRHHRILLGQSPSTFEPLRDLLRLPSFETEFIIDTNPPTTVVQNMNLWDMGNAYTRFGLDFGNLTHADVHDGSADVLLRALLANGYGCVSEGFLSALLLYQAGEAHLVDSVKAYQIVNVIASICLIAFIGKGLMFPIFSKIDTERESVLNLFLTIPQILVAKLVHQKKNVIEGFRGQLDRLERPGFSDSHPSSENSDQTNRKAQDMCELDELMSRNSANSILLRIPDRTRKALAFLAFAVLVVYCHSSVATSEHVLEGSRVALSISREVLCARVASLAREYTHHRNHIVVNGGEHWAPLNLTARIHDTLEELASVHFDLKFGAERRATNHGASLDVLYAWPFLEEEGDNITAAEHGDHAAMTALLDLAEITGATFARDWMDESWGLDHMVVQLIDETRVLLRAADPSPSLHPYRMISRLMEGPLRTKLRLASDLALLEAVTTNDEAMLYQSYGAAAIVLMMIVTYLFVFRETIRTLQAEGTRTLDLLLMIPMETVEDVPIIKQFMETGKAIEKSMVEESMEQIQEQRNSLVEAISDAIIISDGLGIIQQVNSATTNMFGYDDAADFIGRNVTLLMRPEEGEMHNKALEKYMETRRKNIIGRAVERKAVRRGGEVFPVLITVTETTVALQHSFVAVIKDVTDVTRRRADAIRREKEVTNILATASEAIVTSTAEGVITFINQACVDLFGFTQAEALGENVTIFMPKNFADKHDTYLRRFISSGQHVREGIPNLLGKHRSGRVFPVETKLSEIAVGLERKFVAFMCAHVDSETEPDNAESIKRSWLLHNISRQFRTPLDGIVTMVNRLACSDLNGQQGQMVHVINSCCQRLHEMVHDDTSNASDPVASESFSLCHVIDKVMDWISVQTNEGMLEVAALVWPDLPDNVVGDAKRLGQVLLNLCGNAVKFTKEGHILLLCTLKAATADDEVEIMFEVSDSGVGIPEREVGKLFKRFSQTESSSKTAEGTGLGLSICKQLVSKMGGKIGVESAGVPGEGSSFWFTIPLKKQTSELSIAARVNPMFAGSSLLVEHSNTFVRAKIVSWLTALSLCPEPAGKLEQALAIIQHKSGLSVVLFNDGWRGNNITQATAVSTEHLIPKGIPTILMASIDSQGEIMRQKGENFSYVLPKPFSPSRFFNALSEVWKKPFLLQSAWEDGPALESGDTYNGSFDSSLSTDLHRSCPSAFQPSPDLPRRTLEGGEAVRQAGGEGQARAASGGGDPAARRYLQPGSWENRSRSKLSDSLHTFAGGKSTVASHAGLNDSAMSEARKGKEEATEEPAPEGKLSPEGKLVMLIVEDNWINQRMLSAMLEGMGFVCDVANNGIEALERLHSGVEYALVFMDCQMPEMDGYDATRAIRREEEATGLHQSIVACTAHARDEDMQACLACGMDDFLAKPVVEETLRPMLEKWIGG